ncbi:LAME_0E09736g1_1 [Lachancea meyersii CBS 8951]|uniref:LAME_0E09736g1_1 n=1 Tax=Lachancea meyersii CBS 8951 TaxID=1266667 RepID=A0A1G4JJY0_9SACH|nr:LAME_0E09736g1_1 [Lachancea meyersii CBS 8951]
MDRLNIPPPVVNWLFKITQSYYDARTTFRDAMYTLSEFRNLKPRTKVYTDSQGKPQLLLCLYGRFGSEHVSVPVLIWIPREYPILAPYVYVDFDSLRDEVLVPGSTVDANGRFRVPMMDTWSPESWNLRELTFSLASSIMEDPPLVVETAFDQSPPLPERIGMLVQPPLASPLKPPPVREVEQLTRDIGSAKLEDTAPVLPPKPPSALKSASPMSQPTPPARTPQSVEQQPSIMDLDAVDQRSSTYDHALSSLFQLITTLAKEDAQNVTETLRTRMFAAQNATAQFRNICDQESSALEQRERAVTEKRDSLVSGIKLIDAQLDKAQHYVQNYGPECDLSSMQTPDSVGVSQLRNLVARDHAVSDTINALSRLFNQNAITLDVFLRKVRALARDQFLLRLHMNKIVEGVQEKGKT